MSGNQIGISTRYNRLQGLSIGLGTYAEQSTASVFTAHQTIEGYDGMNQEISDMEYLGNDFDYYLGNEIRQILIAKVKNFKIFLKLQ